MSEGSVPKWLVVVGTVVAIGAPVGSVVSNYVTTQTTIDDVKQRVRSLESDQSVKQSVEKLTTQVALMQYQIEQLTEQVRDLKQAPRR